jgi:phage terminase large subunit-like protein
LILAGRGFGKTRTGAEWVRSAAEHLPGLRIALVGATLADTRAIMVEGESGLLAIAPAHDRPIFEPSLRRLTWRNGSMATLYSAAEADGLRGPEHHLGWADECAKWDNGEAAWDNLALSLRLGPAPRLVATTTPRPVPLIRRIMDEAGTVMTRGRTADNGLNLATAFLERMTTLYGGTRLGRQELDGVLIEDVAGALWSRAMMEAAACDGPVPDMRRVVVGVDPPRWQSRRCLWHCCCWAGPRWPRLGAGRCQHSRRLPRRLGRTCGRRRAAMGCRSSDCRIQ